MIAALAVTALLGFADAASAQVPGVPGLPLPPIVTEPQQPAPPPPTTAPAKSPRCPSGNVLPGDTSSSATSKSVLCLLNIERKKRDLKGLKLNKRLSLAALRHSDDMNRRNFFAHKAKSGPGLRERILQVGYLRRSRRFLLAENLAWGSNDTGTPQEIVDAWMKSPHHKENILDRDLRELGVGTVRGSPMAAAQDEVQTAIYTTDFGHRAGRRRHRRR